MTDQPKQPANSVSLEEAAKSFCQFVATIAKLRDKDGGCPWDLKQNHKTLRPFMIEEAYEAFTAMDSNDTNEICDELGDVLLQVILNAQVAHDEKTFSIIDVIDAINSKMIRRHPHVFGATKGEDISSEEVKKRWQYIKDAERSQTPKPNKGYFEKRDIDKIFPATNQALKIGTLAKAINFDWPNVDDVMDKFLSEVEELKEAYADYKKDKSKANKAHLQNEIGDIYFTTAQLSRHLKIDPETAALDGNIKFLKRFAKVEKLAKKKGKSIQDMELAELETLWQAVKSEENK